MVNTFYNSFIKDPYHALIECSWSVFFTVLSSVFILLNLMFAVLYVLGGAMAIKGGHATELFSDQFMNAFFFSVQTLSTIGYGVLHPNTLYSEVIMTFEALIGLLFTALSTGCIFARLSKPTAKIAFSEVFLFTESSNGPCFVFRVANTRQNDLVNAEATLTLLDLEAPSGRLKILKVIDLKLRRNRSPSLFLNWVLIHDLDEESYFHGVTAEALEGRDLIFNLNIVGYDSSYHNTIYSRYRYRISDLRAGVYFRDMIEMGPDHVDDRRIYFDRLSEVEPPPLEPLD